MKITKSGVKLFFSFLLVSLVPLGIAGTIVYKYVHDRTKKEVQRQLRSTAHNLNEQLSLILSKRRFRVADFSSDGFISECVEQIDQKPPDYSQISKTLNTHLIKKQNWLDPNLIEITILNKSGIVIASTLPHLIGNDKSHEDYFRVPFLSLESKGPYFSDAIERSEEVDKLQLVFSAILIDMKLLRPLGVIVTKVKGDIIQNILKTTVYYSDGKRVIDDTGEIYIVNGNKLMITGSTVSQNQILKQVVDTQVVREVLTSKEELSGIYENHKGIRVLTTALFIPEANWVIIVEKSVEEAFSPVARITYIFAFSGGGVLVLVFIFAFVISSNINTIIKKLLEGTRRAGDGNLEHPIMIGKRNDEIKELVESFNLMMKKLRESLREKEVLLREIHHRVKNNMQVISSLLKLQAGNARDEQQIEMLKESQNRIKAMALIHEKLYRSKDLAKIDFSDYVKTLVNDLFLSYKVSTGSIALRINIETVFFGIDTAIPCGLIVNELVSNSLKYAFPEGKNGEISISLHKIPDSGFRIEDLKPEIRDLESEIYELIISDNGIGIPKDLDFRNTESLGLRLITNLAEYQLQGIVELNRSEAAEFHIKFKVTKYKERI